MLVCKSVVVLVLSSPLTFIFKKCQSAFVVFRLFVSLRFQVLTVVAMKMTFL
jgi:hypothetical protein